MSSGQLSQDRLNQIAGNKLADLGIPCGLGDGGRVVGELDAGPALTNPFTGAPIGAAHFVVEGHDQLRFLKPPLLAGLPAVAFFDIDDLSLLVKRVALLLQRRLEGVSRLKTHLHHFRAEAEIDREHGVVVAPILVEPFGTVVLIGDEQGMRTSHVRPKGGGPNQPTPPIAIDLSQFSDSSDLALYLSEIAQRAQPLPDGDLVKTGIHRPPPEFFSPRAADVGFGLMPTTGEFIPPASPSSSGPSLPSAQAEPAAAASGELDDFMPPTQAFEVPASIAGGARGQAAYGDVPAGAVTAGMIARCLGESAQLAHGVAVMRRFQVGPHAIKLTLRQKRGRVFVGRVAWEQGVLWQGELEVDKHPPMDEFVVELLRSRGVAAPPASAPEPRRTPTPARQRAVAPPPSPATSAASAQPAAPAAAAPAPTPTRPFGDAPGERLPVAGEIWMMTVVVEQQDEREVRYSAINAEGNPYGAPRILPKADFGRVFAQFRGGYRLLVRVMGSSPAQVVYVQLDPQYQPNSETRAIAPSIFLANFLPEAASY